MPNQDIKRIETPDFLIRHQIHWLLLSRVILLSLLFAISALLHSQENRLLIPSLQYLGYFIASVYIFTIWSAFLLPKSTNLKGFAFSQILTDVFLTTLLILYSGGSQSVFTFIYFFPIISSGILLFRIQSLLVASFCTLLLGTILFFEYLGFYPKPFEGWVTPLNNFLLVLHHFATPGLTFFLAAFFSSLLSERLRKTEAALAETTLSLDRLSSLYKQIFDDINTGIITVDQHGHITSFNRAAGEITGYSLTEIIGRNIMQIFPGLASSGQKILRPVAELTRKDKITIPIGYSWAKLNMPTSESSKVFTFQDLSQIRKMEDQVRQSEKMASIGEMAAGIAHEFRNPLAAISGAAQMLQGDAADSLDKRLMNIITRESDRLETIIDEFLQYSKPAMPEKKWFSLPGLVDETITILQQTASWPAAIHFDIEIDSPLDCWADRNQLKQIFLNLFCNSSQMMTDSGGVINVRAREVEQDGESSFIAIDVYDSGPGIDDQLKEKIFEPFFTTRKKGTGLGLAIVWQIVDSHGGKVSLGEERINGAHFQITLPLP